MQHLAVDVQFVGFLDTLGLLDEIEIDLVPILLGPGIRLFQHLGKQLNLEQTSIVVAQAVTHLRYNVVK